MRRVRPSVRSGVAAGLAGLAFGLAPATAPAHPPADPPVPLVCGGVHPCEPGSRDESRLRGLDGVYDTDHFRIAYATDGVDRIAGWPDSTYRDALGEYLEIAYALYRDDPRFSLRPPEGDGPIGAAGVPLIWCDVYDLTGVYGSAFSWTAGGECTPRGGGFILIDNDFGRTDPHALARLTTAHEIYHLYQSANAWAWSSFFRESTAEWAELTTWPGDSLGARWFLSLMLATPYITLWEDSPTHRIYGGAVFWMFLDAGVDWLPGRAPAAEILVTECDRGWRETLENALADRGRGFTDVLHQYAVWNCFTEGRDDGAHYPEGFRLPSVRMQRVDRDHDGTVRALEADYRADWAASNYVRFRGPAIRRDLRIELSGDPRLAGQRLVSLIGNVEPNTSVVLGPRTWDETGSLEWTVPDWNVYDSLDLVLTNGGPIGGVPDEALGWTWRAEEIGAPVTDAEWVTWSPANVLRNAPDPSPLGTLARFEMSEGGGPARLTVHDLHGRLVRELADGSFAAGTHNVYWDGHDAAGRRVGSGVYFLRLDCPAGRFLEKVTIVR